MHSTYETLAPRASHPRRSADRWRLPLSAAGGAVWRFLETFSQRKAAAEILELAKSLQSTRPEMAAQMRRAASRSWD